MQVITQLHSNYPVNLLFIPNSYIMRLLIGWYQDIPKEGREMLRDYIHDYTTSDRSLHWSVICRVMGSPVRICMIPMQDYLGLDNTAESILHLL